MGPPSSGSCVPAPRRRHSRSTPSTGRCWVRSRCGKPALAPDRAPPRDGSVLRVLGVKRRCDAGTEGVARLPVQHDQHRSGMARRAGRAVDRPDADQRAVRASALPVPTSARVPWRDLPSPLGGQRLGRLPPDPPASAGAGGERLHRAALAPAADARGCSAKRERRQSTWPCCC